MTPDPVENAEARIREARQRLFSTIGEIQDRLRPSVLAQDAVGSAAQGLASVARKGAAAIRKRPVAVAAFAGAIGLAMARGLIGDLFRNRGRNETSVPPAGLKPRSVTRVKKGSSE